MNYRNEAQKKEALKLDETELSEVSRKMLIWFNSYPEKPVDTIKFEYLDLDSPCMALSTIQGTYVTETDILGAYEAEYQFKLIYRLKPGNSMDRRLKADELLNKIGEWAVWKVETANEPPLLGLNMQVLHIEPATLSSLFARYEDGYEDHQILMRMTYKVG